MRWTIHMGLQPIGGMDKLGHAMAAAGFSIPVALLWPLFQGDVSLKWGLSICFATCAGAAVLLAMRTRISDGSRTREGTKHTRPRIPNKVQVAVLITWLTLIPLSILVRSDGPPTFLNLVLIRLTSARSGLDGPYMDRHPSDDDCSRPSDCRAGAAAARHAVAVLACAARVAAWPALPCFTACARRVGAGNPGAALRAGCHGLGVACAVAAQQAMAGEAASCSGGRGARRQLRLATSVSG